MIRTRYSHFRSRAFMVSFIQRRRYLATQALLILRNEGPGILLEKAIAVLRDRMVPKTYQRWIRCFDTLDVEARRLLEAEIARWGARPSISVLMAVGPADLPQLAAATRTVGRQRHPAWELCIACEPSIKGAMQRQSSSAADGSLQIRIAPGEDGESRSTALNRALKLATGDFIVLLDADGELAEQALYWVAKIVIAHPDVDLIFSDEDKVDGSGRRFDPWFKPDWNSALMLSCDAFGRLGAYRRSLVEQAGGFRPGFEGAEDYDLVLRCSQATAPARIRHVARVLYHRRTNQLQAEVRRTPPEANEAGRRAVNAHLVSRGIHATVRRASSVGYRVEYPLSSPLPRVSVLVPTTGQPHLLGPCLNWLLARTTYGNFEVLLLVNEAHRTIPERAQLLDRAAADDRVRVLGHPDQPFNFSRVNNRGADQASGDILCLLNDDTEVVTTDWLERLAARVTLDGVGAAGPMLYYPDDTIQHAGVILGIGGVATHDFRTMPRGHIGYFGGAALERDVSCVTAGCMAIRANVFRDLGGFNEELAIAFNDVDLCLRLRAAGWRIIWTPAVELTHHEFASLGPHNAPEGAARFSQDVAWMRRRWGAVLDDDPFYNRNLSLTRPYELAFPPRPCREPG